ncbi:hypothetical protein IQ266_26335 [filamentous cyanobacterium LEGE 11480]|uniref:Uncharacterized protein n=1 Tax=Romeriopsis navalis LEGE 11480 TaxID=2777977 RepID=A0A928Z6Q9_9CYAN|nr:hypothetical protein [Romeriopsis navalis]MBE9033257.1 hypothetical protein [Romeriopsis navalis LEGE 11480]
MKSLFLVATCFGVGLPVLIVGLSSLNQAQLTASNGQCAGAQVFRASDQSCYTLQGE